MQAKQEDDHLGKQSTLHCMLAVLGIFDSFLIYDIFNLLRLYLNIAAILSPGILSRELSQLNKNHNLV